MPLKRIKKLKDESKLSLLIFSLLSPSASHPAAAAPPGTGGIYVVLPEGKGKARLKGAEMGQHVLRRMRGGEGHFGNFGVVFFQEPQGTQGMHACTLCTKQFLAAAVAHKQAFFRQYRKGVGAMEINLLVRLYQANLV